MKNLEFYLGLPWDPVIDTVTEDDEEYVRLTVKWLADFAVYGDSISEVKARWREALESHLSGYLAVGKTIPEPVQLEMVDSNPAESTGSIGEAANMLRKKPLVPA